MIAERFLRRIQRACELAPVLLESYGSAQVGHNPVERRPTAAAAEETAAGTGQRRKRGRGRAKCKYPRQRLCAALEAV